MNMIRKMIIGIVACGCLGLSAVSFGVSSHLATAAAYTNDSAVAFKVLAGPDCVNILSKGSIAETGSAPNKKQIRAACDVIGSFATLKKGGTMCTTYTAD